MCHFRIAFVIYQIKKTSVNWYIFSVYSNLFRNTFCYVFIFRELIVFIEFCNVRDCGYCISLHTHLSVFVYLPPQSLATIFAFHFNINRLGKMRSYLFCKTYWFTLTHNEVVCVSVLNNIDVACVVLMHIPILRNGTQNCGIVVCNHDGRWNGNRHCVGNENLITNSNLGQIHSNSVCVYTVWMWLLPVFCRYHIYWSYRLVITTHNCTWIHAHSFGWHIYLCWTIATLSMNDDIYFVDFLKSFMDK